MFGINDVCTLTGINVLDKKGKTLAMVIKIPFDESIEIPETVREITIIEYLLDTTLHTDSFRILVGKRGSLTNLRGCDFENQSNICRQFNAKNCHSTDDVLCYQEMENGKKCVYAVISDGDIVVENVEELKQVLRTLSERFKEMKTAVDKIREVRFGDRAFTKRPITSFRELKGE